MPDLAQLKLELREIHGAHEFTAYYDLRWRVLREPWMQARESERDQRESDAIHMGCWAEGRLAGIGRLHLNSKFEAQIRFMAVESGFDRQGIGTQILLELERHACLKGTLTVVLDARKSAMPFYEKHGYKSISYAGLLFDQIEHWKMSKSLYEAKKSNPGAPASPLTLL